jgi:hypothetical protein
VIEEEESSGGMILSFQMMVVSEIIAMTMLEIIMT